MIYFTLKTMEISQYPPNPKDWTPELIYEICNRSDVESETFDLKLEPTKLYEDICAMANTNNGFIVLGIDEDKKDEIPRFVPVGFPKKNIDDMINNVSNLISNVDPIPKVLVEPISDEKKNIFFVVLKIIGSLSDKPYFVKGSDQCYVRIQRSSRRVGRSIILNMFSTLIQKRKNLERLRSSLVVLKHEITDTMERIRGFSTENQTRTAPVDLSLVRNFVIENESYLTSNELLGNRTGDTISNGIVPVLRTVEILNEQIKAYNSNFVPLTKSDIRSQIVVNGHLLNSELVASKNTIDKIVTKIDAYLSEFH